MQKGDRKLQLVIAEKPSVARNIAKVLHATNVKDGYLEGKEYLVSWCIGHLIELASADQYRYDWKAWKYETDIHYLHEFVIPFFDKENRELRIELEQPKVLKDSKINLVGFNFSIIQDFYIKHEIR